MVRNKKTDGRTYNKTDKQKGRLRNGETLDWRAECSHLQHGKGSTHTIRIQGRKPQRGGHLQGLKGVHSANFRTQYAHHATVSDSAVA